MICTSAEFKRVVAELLQKRVRKEFSGPGMAPSAVLIPFYEKDSNLQMLFTERTNRVAYHKGQLSFPGGAKDTEDRTLLDAALRECAEEIGLDTSSVEILGALDDTPTVASNYIITPYVGFLSGAPRLSLNHEEVDRVIEMPFDVLLSHRFPVQERIDVDGEIRTVPGYRYNGHFIWGATARLVQQFLDLVRPEFEGVPAFGSPQTDFHC